MLELRSLESPSQHLEAFRTLQNPSLQLKTPKAPKSSQHAEPCDNKLTNSQRSNFNCNPSMPQTAPAHYNCTTTTTRPENAESKPCNRLRLKVWTDSGFWLLAQDGSRLRGVTANESQPGGVSQPAAVTQKASTDCARPTSPEAFDVTVPGCKVQSSRTHRAFSDFRTQGFREVQGLDGFSLGSRML